MPQDTPAERDLEELTVEELEAQEALTLPDRAALSLISVYPTVPVDPATMPDVSSPDVSSGDPTVVADTDHPLPLPPTTARDPAS